MSNTVGSATIELGIDAAGVDSGLQQADGSINRTGRNLANLGEQGSRALNQVGAGSTAAAARIDAATRNIAGAVERANAALISGKKSGADYFEELARNRGADMLKLAPLIAQLRETEAAQQRVTAATEATRQAQLAAAEAARVQAAAMRDIAQAQAGRDSFLNGLREQIQLYGKSTEEVLRFRAAQAGAADSAAPLILQLQNVRAAHDAVTEATRLQAQAQRQAEQAQANRDSFLSGLREQVTLFGKSAEEVLRYRAALAGASADAEPLIQQIERLKAAENAAAEAARNAERARHQAAQVQANSDAFLAGLREQIALYGKSAEEILRYKAAQAGAASAAEPQIQALERLRVAQEATAEAARLAAAAQQQAAQVQATKDSFLAGLREQITLYGKSTEEVLRYRAAQAGVAGAAEPLIQELQRVKAAQDAVAESTRNAERAQQQAAQQQASGLAMVANLREQIALYGKTTEEVMRYKAAQAGVAGAAEPHIQELARLKAAEEAVAAAARAAAEAQRAAAQVQTGRDNFINSLQQEAAAIGKTRLELLELKAAEMGVTAQAAPFIQALRASEQGMGNAGMSARALAAAMRGVPAQFSDIVVSLQGGQAPLTVLLQQGGQLKDMFGGLGNAAKALGSYIASLITPITVAVAAAVALTAAFALGRHETTEYNKALILAGSTANTTASQLTNMAASISKTVGTQGAAAEALIAMVGTGKVAASNLQEFSQVAIKAQRALGQSVGDTATQFADLGKAPVAALVKLNEQYHFLTPEVYKQVKALEMQGSLTQAAAVAQKAYAAALDDVSTKVTANLGTLEKGWKGVKDLAAEAWDAMLGVGRTASLDQQLEKATERLQAAQKNRFGFLGSAEFKEAQAAVTVLENQIRLEREKTDAQASGNKAREAGLKWAQDEEKYLTRAAQLEREIARARTEGQASAGFEETAAETEKRIGERVAAIRKQFADIAFEGTNSQIAAIERRGAIEVEVARRTALDVSSARALGIATSLDAQISYAEQIEALDQAALEREKAGLRQRIALQKQLPDSPENRKAIADAQARIDLNEQQALTRKQALRQEILALEVKDTRQAANNYADLADKRAADLDALEKQVQAQRDANSVIGMSKEQLNAFNKTLVEEAANRKEVDAAILDSIVGREAEAETLRATAAAMRALAEEQRAGILKAAQFEQQKKIWESIDQTAHDTFVSIFDSGKSAFDRLRDTLKNGLLDLLYQMTIKRWIFNIGAQVTGNAAIGDLGGALGGALGGSSSGAGSLLSNGATLLSIGKTIYSGFAGGIATSLGGLVSSFGSAIGSAAVTSFGTGMGLTTAQAAAMAATAGGTTAGAAAGGALTAGASAAAAIPIIGWIIAGMSASKGLYAQGWDAHNGSVSTIGGLAGGNAALWSDTVLQKLGMSAVGANILSGQATIAKLFGRKNPEIESQGIQGTLSAAGFSGENFANILEKGGWFRSDKRYTQTVAVGADQDSALDDTMSALVLAVKGFGGAIGTEAGAIDGYNKAIKITLGKDEAENKDAIAKMFAGVADDLSSLLVPNLAKLSNEGESASAALQRLSSDYVAMDDVFRSIGTSFGAVGVGSLDARERLLELAGGLDAFTQNAAGFAQNYLTEAERLAPVKTAVRSSLDGMGYSAVDTRDEFKNLVLGTSALYPAIDKTTEAGAKQYTQLMALQAAFAAVYPAIESTTVAARSAADIAQERANLQKESNQIFMTDAEKERASIDDSNVALYEMLLARRAEKEAMDAAAKAAADAEAARKSTEAGIQSDIDALVRASLPLSEQRALDVSGMAASTLALYEHREALQAEAKAAADAEQAIKDKAAAESKAISSQDSIRSSFSTDEQKLTAAQRALSAGFAELHLAVPQTAADFLALSEGAKASTAEGQGLIDALAKLAPSFGIVIDATKKAAVDAKAAADKIAADAQAAIGKQASFRDTYLTDPQKLANAYAAVQKGFADLKLPVPADAAEWLKLSDGADAATKKGQDLLAALELLSPSFKIVQDALAEVAKQNADAAKSAADLAKAAADEIAQAAAQAYQALMSVNQGYQDQIDEFLKASMTAAEVRALEIRGMDGSTVVLYDRLRALQAEAAISEERAGLLAELASITDTSTEAEARRRAAINESNRALYDQVTAATAQKAAAEALAATNKSVQGQIDDLIKATLPLAEQRTLELAGLDATTAALKLRLFALQDEQSALAAAVAVAKQQRTLDIQLMEESGDAAGALAAKRADELAAMDASLRGTQELIYAAQDAATALATAKTATDNALASVQKAIDAERSRIGVIRDVASESVNQIKSVFDLLKSSVASLYGTVASTSTMQVNQGNAFIDNALAAMLNSGYLPDSQELSDAIAAARGGLDATQFATQFEADRAALVMAGKLSQLQAASGTQLTVAEQALKAAEDQLSALDAQLAVQQQQVDLLRNGNANTLSISAAITALAAAIGRESAGTVTPTAPSTTAPPIKGWDGGFVPSDDLLNGVPPSAALPGPVDVTGLSKAQLDYYNLLSVTPGQGSGPELLQYVAALQDVQALFSMETMQGIKNDPRESADDFMIRHGYKFNPYATDVKERYSFSQGINRVPFEMTARIHPDEAVVPAAFNPFNPNAQMNGLGAQAANTVRLERLVEAMTARLERMESLLADGNKNTAQVASSTSQLAEQFDNATAGGNAMMTEVA